MTTFVSTSTSTSSSSCSFGALQTEFYARGFDYLNDSDANRTRAKRWLNQSYLALCETYPWPFLELTESGTPPLTLNDVREILTVTDTVLDRELDWLDLSLVLERYGARDTTGTAEFFYLENNVLRVYPLDTTLTVDVRYLGVPDELELDDDVPLVPCRFSDLIIDGAVIKAYKDSDNFDAATALQQSLDRDLDAMAGSLLARSNIDRIELVEPC